MASNLSVQRNLSTTYMSRGNTAKLSFSVTRQASQFLETRKMLSLKANIKVPHSTIECFFLSLSFFRFLVINLCSTQVKIFS